MLGYLLAPLRDKLRPHFNLSKTRLATMAIILFGRNYPATPAPINPSRASESNSSIYYYTILAAYLILPNTDHRTENPPGLGPTA